MLKYTMVIASMVLSVTSVQAQEMSLSPPAATVHPTTYPPYTPPVAPLRKKTVCTATINSDDEKQVFQEYLHPDYFQFVELLKNNRDTGFLKRACANPAIQCDVLLVSAHFGGTFTGKNFEMPFSDFQAASCGGCGNILKSAQMVYLFGCTTLAGKGDSIRTPEEFYQTLRSIGQDEATARANVATRFSAIGQSFNEGMRRVFMGVPVLNGFSDKGPLGEQVRPLLKSLFGGMLPAKWPHDGKIDDLERRMISQKYYEELDALKVKQATGELNQRWLEGKSLNPRMRVSMGPTYSDVAGIVPGSNEEYVGQKMCSMGRSNEERLQALYDIAATGDRGSVVSVLPHLIDLSKRGTQMTSGEQMMFSRLSQLTALRDVMISDGGILVQLAKAPYEQIRTADLALRLGFIDQYAYQIIYQQAGQYVVNNSRSFLSNKDLLARLKNEIRLVNPDSLEVDAWNSESIWQLIQEMGLNNFAWQTAATANIGTTANALIAEYHASQRHMAEINNKKNSLSKVIQKRIKNQRNLANSFCQNAIGMGLGRDVMKASLAPYAANLKAMGASKCKF